MVKFYEKDVIMLLLLHSKTLRSQSDAIDAVDHYTQIKKFTTHGDVIMSAWNRH